MQKLITLATAILAAVLVSCNGKTETPGGNTEPEVEIKSGVKVGTVNFASSSSSLAALALKEVEVIALQNLPKSSFGSAEAMLGSNYLKVETGAEDGVDGYNHLYYDGSAVEVVDGGLFWLRGYSDKPGLGWTREDGDYMTCVYALFRRLDSGKQFWVFNSRLDPEYSFDRNRGLITVSDKIASIAKGNTPVFFAGEMSNTPQSSMFNTIRGKLLNLASEDSDVSSMIWVRGRLAVKEFKESPMYVEASFDVKTNIYVASWRGPSLGSLTSGTAGFETLADTTRVIAYDDVAHAVKLEAGKSYQFVSAVGGNCSYSVYAAGWKGQESYLVVEVTGGATIGGSSRARVKLRSLPDATDISPFILNLTAEDKYTFDISNAGPSTIVRVSVEGTAVVLCSNVEGGEAISGRIMRIKATDFSSSATLANGLHSSVDDNGRIVFYSTSGVVYSRPAMHFDGKTDKAVLYCENNLGKIKRIIVNSTASSSNKAVVYTGTYRMTATPASQAAADIGIAPTSIYAPSGSNGYFRMEVPAGAVSDFESIEILYDDEGVVDDADPSVSDLSVKVDFRTQPFTEKIPTSKVVSTGAGETYTLLQGDRSYEFLLFSGSYYYYNPLSCLRMDSGQNSGFIIGFPKIENYKLKYVTVAISNTSQKKYSFASTPTGDGDIYPEVALKAEAPTGGSRTYNFTKTVTGGPCYMYGCYSNAIQLIYIQLDYIAQ